MVIQIINLSYHDIFKRYSGVYKIFREVYQPGLLGLEIRNITDKLAEKVHKIVLKEDEISYKFVNQEKKILSLVIPGSIKSIKELSRKILSSGDEDLGYKIANVIKNYEEYDSKVYKIGDTDFSFDKAYTMGILNVTPDSFSDGGKYINVKDATGYALGMINDGADIIDIGGESSRPGSEHVGFEEEIARVIPVIDKILERKPGAIISVDTTKSKVAEAALQHGAKIINDISALSFEPGILDIVKQYKASLVLMHMKGTPQNMQDNPAYDDVIQEIYDFFFERIQMLGRNVKNVFLDPGIGFGKTVENNFEILRRLEDFKSLGFPILIGVSRKSFIGKTLGLETNEREPASAIIESVAVKNGARIIRTHNVKYGVQVCKLLNNLM